MRAPCVDRRIGRHVDGCFFGQRQVSVAGDIGHGRGAGAGQPVVVREAPVQSAQDAVGALLHARHVEQGLAYPQVVRGLGVIDHAGQPQRLQAVGDLVGGYRYPGVHGPYPGQRRQPGGRVVMGQMEQDGVAVPEGEVAIGQRGNLLKRADALEFFRLILARQHIDEVASVVLADKRQKEPDFVAIARARVVVECQHSV